MPFLASNAHLGLLSRTGHLGPGHGADHDCLREISHHIIAVREERHSNANITVRVHLLVRRSRTCNYSARGRQGDNYARHLQWLRRSGSLLHQVCGRRLRIGRLLYHRHLLHRHPLSGDLLLSRPSIHVLRSTKTRQSAANNEMQRSTQQEAAYRRTISISINLFLCLSRRRVVG